MTPTGYSEYLVMPNGQHNAPSVFQDFMHEVVRDFLDQFEIVYIDDILIYLSKHAAEVLQCLREHHLHLNAEKCSFHLSSIQFPG